MPKYRFTAVDAKGKEISGSVDADSENAAISLIREKGLLPTQVTAAISKAPARTAASSGAPKKAPKAAKSKPSSGKGKGKGSKDVVLFGGGKVKQQDLELFTRQLSTLVNAGLPLMRSLQVLARQEKNPAMKQVMVDMGDSISSGSTFAEALVAHPKVFDRLFVNMVKAGEVGGVLDKVLYSLSSFMEKMRKIRGKVRSAMVYPLVVLFMATVILFFLMLSIVPKFQEIFTDILGEGAKLPALTRGVMAVSNFMQDFWWVMIIGVFLLVAGIIGYGRTESGRYNLDNLKIRNPLFGVLVLKTSIARFSRTLGTLMEAGVPILQALTIVGDTSGNQVIARGVRTIHDAVKEGENVAPPMESTGLFPAMVVSMVEVGEETGDLPMMLGKIADNYEEEVDNAVAALTSIIEPIMIVFLAVIVGSIVLAVFLPMLELMKGIGQ